MNYLKLASIILLFLFLSSCQSDPKKDSDSVESSIAPIAELVDRSLRIQLGQEWDFVQNFYVEKKKALKEDPKDLESAIQLSELFVKEARVTGEHGHYYPAALELLDYTIENAEAKSDFLFRGLVTKAGVQLSLHEFSNALSTAQKALSYDVHNAQLYGVLTDCYVELGDYNKAVAMSDKMINIKPDIRSYSRVSYLREIHGDFDGAVDALTLAIKSGFPGNEETSWAMLTLADLYNEYNRNVKAANVYNQILALRKDYPFAISGLGTLAFKQDDLVKAESLQKEAMNIIPELGYFYELGKIYKKQGRQKELDELLKEILLMLEDDVNAGHNMNLEYSDIYLELFEDSDKALEYAKMEFDKRPKNIDVNMKLAKIYALDEQKALAKKHLSAAMITNSKDPAIDEIVKLLE